MLTSHWGNYATQDVTQDVTRDVTRDAIQDVTNIAKHMLTQGSINIVTRVVTQNVIHGARPHLGQKNMAEVVP